MKALRIAYVIGLCACVQTTGSALVSFQASVAGPEDAAMPLSFANEKGYAVTLNAASVLIGAVYLNRSVPNWGSQRDSCTNPGIYVAQAFGPVEADLLSPVPHGFPGRVEGTTDQAYAAEVWLGTSDIYAEDASEIVARFSGVAQKDAVLYPFSGEISLGNNRSTPSLDALQPGANPPCFIRIVSPLAVDITPGASGHLILRVDPRAWFRDVEFSELDAREGAYVFADVTRGQPQLALFSRFRALEGTFSFTWQAP
jgi:hypothetical protein